VEKYCRVGQATDDSMYYLLRFHCDNGCKNTSQLYVIRTVPVLLNNNLVC